MRIVVWVQDNTETAPVVAALMDALAKVGVLPSSIEVTNEVRPDDD